MVAPVVARGPFSGHYGERLPNPTATNTSPAGQGPFLAVPDAPDTPSPGAYTPEVLSPQFQAADTGGSAGTLGFRRSVDMGDGSSLTVTHEGLALGQSTGSNMRRSQSASGTRTNVALAGGYYFRKYEGVSE